MRRADIPSVHNKMREMKEMWMLLAVLSALFAALTTILAKIGLAGVNSNLATAIRTGVVLVMAWIIVFLTGRQAELGGLSGKNWVFLAFSGVATGLSWLCYYRAVQLGPVSKVAPIDKFSLVITVVLAALLLGERVGPKEILGCAMITGGLLVMVL